MFGLSASDLSMFYYFELPLLLIKWFNHRGKYFSKPASKQMQVIFVANQDCRSETIENDNFTDAKIVQFKCACAWQ